MPIELRYRDDETGVVFVCTGTVTADDFSRANEEVYSAEPLERLQYQLIDFSDTEHLESSLEDIRKNAQVDATAAHQSRGLVIAVAGPDDLTFGISRMWQSIVSGSNIRTGVLRSVCDAERWIKKTLHGS